MGQLIYTMLVRNNCTLFHLRWKENLVKHSKLLKYYETDCLQNFLLLFKLLLRAKLVKVSYILVRIFFIFLKDVLKHTWISLNTKFEAHWKDQKSSWKVRDILGLFCHLISLIFGQNSVKDLRVTKNLKEIKFEGVLGELEKKIVSRHNNLQNIWE